MVRGSGLLCTHPSLSWAQDHHSGVTVVLGPRKSQVLLTFCAIHHEAASPGFKSQKMKGKKIQTASISSGEDRCIETMQVLQRFWWSVHRTYLLILSPLNLIKEIYKNLQLPTSSMMKECFLTKIRNKTGLSSVTTYIQYCRYKNSKHFNDQIQLYVERILHHDQMGFTSGIKKNQSL